MPESELIVGFALAWTVISFYLYWPVFLPSLTAGKVKRVLLLRIYGFVLFGMIPLLIVALVGADLKDSFGLILPKGDLVWHIIAFSFCLLCVPVSFLQSRRASNLSDYPQIRKKVWTIRLLVLNILTWMIYLTGYEMLFRGILLFPLVKEFEIAITLIINAALYSLTHMSKGFREGLGTLPIGVVMFFIAFKTESIVYPMLIHWTMAISNSLFSLHHHPKMKIQFNK